MRCGRCCRRAGYVLLQEREVDAIAAELGLSVYDFTARFTRLTVDRRALSLRETEDGRCVFLREPAECMVQAAKPRQCRDFPERWNFPGYEKICRAFTGRNEDK